MGDYCELLGISRKKNMVLDFLYYIALFFNIIFFSSTQAAVWYSDIRKEHDSDIFGVILPRTAVSGTITRRAVEATWLTASNYKVFITKKT
jgi:hypothetical protein